MNRVIFARASTNRKPEFQLITMLKKSDESLSAHKCAANSESEAHLQSFLPKRSLLLRANIACDVAPVRQLAINEVVFNFVSGKSLETEFHEALKMNDTEKIRAVFDQVFSLIDSLQTIKCNPTDNVEFRKIFGSYYDYEIDCVIPACIDFNLDNIIKQNGKLTLIDYEWVFDFPVPKDFIKLRVLHAAFLETQTILLKAGPNKTMILLNDVFFLPKELYVRYKTLFKDVSAFVRTNLQFLNCVQVLQAKINTRGSIEELPANELIKMISPLSIGQPRILENLADRVEQVKTLEMTLKQQQELLAAKQKRINQLEHTLTYMILQRAEIRLREALHIPR